MFISWTFFFHFVFLTFSLEKSSPPSKIQIWPRFPKQTSKQEKHIQFCQWLLWQLKHGKHRYDEAKKISLFEALTLYFLQ